VTEYVTLVRRGRTPIRLANAFGAPWPTSGTGSLVFANGATLTNVTFLDPIYAGDYTFAGSLTIGDNAVIDGTLFVGGATTLDAAATITGNLTVGGTLILGTALPVTSGGTGVTGFGVVTSKTASYAVLAADSYKDFDNNGAAGSVTFTLPASTVGLAYGFAVMEAQDLVVDAPGGVTIYLGEISTTAGGTITSNAVGSYLFIKCRSATEWIVQSSMGTWTPA